MAKVSMYINGQWVDSVSGETFQDMNLSRRRIGILHA